MESILGLLLGIAGGGGAGFFIVRSLLVRSNQKKVDEINQISDLELEKAKLAAKRILDEAENKAEKIVSKAETKNESIKQQKIGETKDNFNRLKSEFESFKSGQMIELKERELKLGVIEKEVKTLKLDVENREAEIKTVRENLDKQLKIVAKKKEELEEANEKRIHELQQIAKLSESEAKEILLTAVRAKASNDALVIEREVIENAKANANKEAKKIVIQTIQRMCAEYTIENSVSVFNLDSDDIKGQIIGREGRNIRALEAATGAEIVVDDTPEAIVISSFDPIRREIARLSLKRLVADGRIHPARIEEVVAKVKKQLDEQIVEIGERTIIDLDIHGLDPYLVKMVGRMRFRSSYGQNLLEHSSETANLCAVMAAELGLNPKQIKMAKRAGLLHDIGKVAEEESELSHALFGMKLCEKYNEHEVIINAVGAHHDEIEMNNIISPIVQACDAISGARPGARREILESYLKRINELEELAMAYEGVSKAYALQAGRELRVIVESEKVTDQYADDLAFMISQKIQDEMQYPGQVKVTVIREKRATAFAR
ncbi:MAG: ribonuclease Y [Saprospiraceae bacterium]|nr:ribonuclease Y [Candidatus Vicinibacter affinis]MBP6174158.1 ribonuclease Y [Saprospiraceae bacterium]MBK6573900.1 ribonuclease Y [Candidatus Vicinibacter affinis]MBK6821656.1 ribonuclease Y [Candidatus Vicinibacter affinis]MBK7302843.1 ribonuclease Y [Candidatus Vicinibacter affinis]